MVSPAVIAGFAAIDASVLGQLFYAVRSYERHHHDDRDRTPAPRPAREYPAPRREH